MKCHFCQKTLDEKVSFRSVCWHCGKDLHSCTACRFFAKEKPNSCLVLNSEHVRDKEKNNFCEDFVYTDKSDLKTKISKDKIAQKLFKEDIDDQKSTNFNDLFKD
jgi:hypothetical protein